MSGEIRVNIAPHRDRLGDGDRALACHEDTLT
jgi:hypothetical protein